MIDARCPGGQPDALEPNSPLQSVDTNADEVDDSLIPPISISHSTNFVATAEKRAPDCPFINDVRAPSSLTL